MVFNTTFNNISVQLQVVYFSDNFTTFLSIIFGYHIYSYHDNSLYKHFSKGFITFYENNKAFRLHETIL
jgi:hypothetical protein